MRNVSKMIETELDQIARQHDGILYPEHVVEFAKDPETTLYGQFDWDDSTAAHKHRLWQARQIIAMCVTVVKEDRPEQRAYVSLESNRQNGGGYRYVVDVLSDKDLRGQLMSQALREFRGLRRKYEELRELAKVFEAIDQIEQDMLDEPQAEQVVVAV